MKEICFVTGNQNKLREVKKILKNYKILSLEDLKFFEDIPETESTIKGNAFLKSSFIYNKFKINCFSDDTGLFIKELDGEPGVKSARYASNISDSEKNIDLVLKNLKSAINRSAYFETTICLIIDGDIKYFNGKVIGKITTKRIGRKGFGYDPIFIPYGYDKTLAQFTLKQKNKISHRSIAVRKLVDYLNKYIS